MKRSKRGSRLWIGVAGWNIPTRFGNCFPEAATHLERYAGKLEAVEINSSFRHRHSRATYERWAASVPREFRFSVKMPQSITHESDLRPSKADLDSFLEAATGLGRKLGVLLVQLPPSHEFRIARTRTFFRNLRDRVSCGIVCEPRHISWKSERAEALLAGYRVSRVGADPPPWEGADLPSGSREITYFRLHGSPRRYYSNYERDQLELVRARIDLASRQSKSVWCIFDNTTLGCATGNALDLSRAFREHTENHVT